MKTVSWLLVSMFLFVGCATHYVKPDASLQESQSDLKSCKKTGLRVAGWVMVGVGIATVPIGLLLALPGAAMVATSDKGEKDCMHELGYSQESN